jgi:hypothetical protein
MLVKHNNNSISELTTAGQLAQGKMTLISEQTASGSASISFTSGIDSTYPIYKFEFINIHPATDTAKFTFQVSTDGGSSYGVTATSSSFRATHNESGTTSSLAYDTSLDLAQSTSFASLNRSQGNASDENSGGTLTIFNPSSTTFVKHWISVATNYSDLNDGSSTAYTGGYFNTTSAINAVQFKMNSGNIDAGTIKLYGIGE